MSTESVMPSIHLIPLIPFSSCLQSFPASASFPMSQFFTSDGQNIGASASASVLPVNIQDWFTFQDWFPLRLTDLNDPKRKFEFMAKVRAGIINWPGKRIPSSNIMSKQKRISNQSSLRKSILNIHWKDWCWSWSSNIFATWCTQPTHWKRSWC